MGKTKVLYLVTKGNWGGAQKYTYDLATSLPSHSFDVTVVFGAPAELKKLLDEKNIRNITIPELGRDISPFKDYASFKELIRLFKKEKPDIVHLNSSKVGGLGAFAARIAGVKRIIFTAHGWPFGEDRSPLSKLAIKFLSWLTIILCHKAIALHEQDLHAFDHWPFAKGKIVKIYNGVRPEKYLSKTEARKLLTEKYNVTFGKSAIGTIAELHKNKDLPYLIEAMRKLPETLSLCIIGDGEERKNLESLIRREHLGQRIFLTGFIPDAKKLLKTFDLFVLPSVKEGFPFVLLEAGLANTPIIATTVGGIPEIIENKKDGLLVPPKNPTALVEAINTLFEDKALRTRCAETFAKKIKEKFDFEKVTYPMTSLLYIDR